MVRHICMCKKMASGNFDLTEHIVCTAIMNVELYAKQTNVLYGMMAKWNSCR